MNTTDVQYSACVYCSPKDSSSHTPQMTSAAGARGVVVQGGVGEILQ